MHGRFNKERTHFALPTALHGLKCLTVSPNYVIVEVPLKHYASSYIPRSHRKGCCRCFYAVHQFLMYFIWSLLFQSSLPYHNYSTALVFSANSS